MLIFSAAEFAMQVFGSDGAIDGTLLGKFMYCMNVNPSQDQLKKLGMTVKEGEF